MEGRLADAAWELDRIDRERRIAAGTPTGQRRRHKIVVEMTDPKKTHERIEVVRFYRERGDLTLSSFLDHADEADYQKVESLLRIN